MSIEVIVLGIRSILYVDSNLIMDATAERIMRGAAFNDVVIVSALRTPICKARRGGLKVACTSSCSGLD